MNAGVSSARHAERIERLQEALGRTRAAAALVGVGPELEWLVGYTARGFERLNLLVVPAAGRPTLVVPRLEASAASSASGVTGAALDLITWGEREDPFPLVASGLRATAANEGRLLVSDGLRAAFLLRLQAALPDATFGVASDVLGPMRRAKDAEEVDRLRTAAGAADRALTGVVAGRLVGRSEADIAREVADRLVVEGHDVALFTIVASGPDSASPHHEPSARVIRAGEPLLLDIGGRASGYCSDITRTVWVGGADAIAPDPEFVATHDLVREAQERGRAAVRAGVALGEVDEAAREVIEAAGHGEHFFHRLGHGIGLEVHEEPYVVAGSHELVTEGDAFSVEPGIYLEGRYGVRIEDIVTCTADGAITLNAAPRELLVVSGV
jgi:Xaa-Pro aminopeptidase